MSRGSTARFGSSYYSASGRPRARAPAPRGGLGPRSGTTRQAKRTGGWSNPVSGSELKFKDTTLTNTALGLASASFTTPGPTFLLNGLVPDSTATGRIGRKVVLKSLLIRWSVSMAATSTLGAPVRVIVFYDKQSNATAATAAQLLLADAITSPRNLDNSRRFKILSDDTVAGMSVNGNTMMKYVKRIPLNLPVEFNANSAGTIGDIVTGGLFLGVWTNNGFGGAQPVSTCYTRVYFQG